MEQVRLKRLVSRVNVKSQTPNLKSHIDLEDIQSWTGKHSSHVGDVESDQTTFQPGDVLFGKLRPYLAKVVRPLSEGTCSSELLVLRPGKNVETNFLFYAAIDKKFIDLVDSSTYGAKMPRASWDFIGQIPIALPDFERQLTIALFLDRKTTQIDALIARKRRQIELLKEKRAALITRAVTKGLDPHVKMKDSGVEWLGEIPQSWDMFQIRRGLDLLTDYEANGSFADTKANVRVDGDDEYAWYVRATDLEKGRSGVDEQNRYCDKPSYNYLAKTKLYGGELLITKRGEIGKCYIMPNIQGYATLAPNLYLLRLNHNLNPSFAFYWFRSELGRSQLVLSNKSTTIGALYKDDVKALRIPFPPRDEQDRIVQDISKSIGRIDDIILKINSSIVLLLEFRTSLISEAVTGKLSIGQKL